MDRPNLTIPQRAAAPRPLLDGRTILFAGLIAVWLGVMGWQQYRTPGRPRGAPANTTSTLSQADLEQLALRLEDKNLSSAAANTWNEYLAAASVPAEREAQIRVRIGRLLQQAGQNEQAVANLYRAEALAGTNKAILGEDFAVRVRDCFREMGRYGELTREVEERTSIASNNGDLAGRQIVAEIGSEKITTADLDRMLHDEVESMIRSSPGITPDQVSQVRKMAQEQYGNAEARGQLLQQIVMQRVLAREARERKIDQDAAYRDRLVHEADTLLASALTNKVTEERASITPADIERFYAANKQHYETPARGQLAQIVCKSKDDAAKVIELLDGGAKFEKLAQDRSTDASTKSAGGALRDPLRADGNDVPGAGENKDLHAKLWNLKSGEYTKDSCQVGDNWIVYLMVDKQDAHTPKLADIHDRVESDCRQARRGEILQQYVQEMFKKYDVKLHRGAVAATSQSAQTAQAKGS